MSFVAVFLANAVIFQSAGQLASVELDTLAARASIKSGRIDLRYIAKSDLQRPVSDRIELYFTDTCRFMKVINEGERALYPSNTEPKTTRFIITPTLFMTHSRENFSTGRGRIAAYVDHLKSFEALKNRPGNTIDESSNIEHKFLFDPRIIGFTPISLGHFQSRALHSYVCGPRQTSSDPENVVLDGLDVAKIQYTSSRGSVIELWISVDRGNSPIRLQATEPKEPDGTYVVSTMEAELAEFPDGTRTCWFPKRIKQTRKQITDQSEEILDVEEISIIEAEFNVQIDEKQFSLSALDLPDDTLIIHRPDAFVGTEEKEYLANNSSEEVVTTPFTKWKETSETQLTKSDVESRKRSLPGKAATAIEPGGSRIWNLIWLNLLAVGIFLVWSGIRSRKQSSK